MNKRIVVLSGSFNPVSKAHFAILSNAVCELNADKGLFVATSDEYLLSKTRVKAKSRTSFLLNEATRREMISSLSKEDPRLSFWGFELGGAYPSTEKTLRRIGKENPGDQIYYLCGADKLRSIPHWTNADSLLEFVHLSVYGRADFDVDALLKSDPFYQAHRDHVIILPAQDDLLDVSSTKIREKFFAGEDYTDLMNESAYAIMKEFKPSDFPPLTAEQIIEATIKYGGHFGKNTARKLVFKENMRLFRDFEGNGFGHRERFVNDTKVYAKEFSIGQLPTNKTTFDCQNICCAEAAFNLINEGYSPAILNMASSKSPCGGYDEGMEAQEESLCQMSTLSVSLYQFGNPKKKCVRDMGYDEVHPDVYPLNENFGGIYTPNVMFFRYPIEEYFALREKRFSCGVISVPSLSYKYALNEGNSSPYFNEDGHLSKVGKEVQSNKIRTILRIALDHAHDALVLGAFGCGDYGLNPDEIARIFFEVFQEEEFKDRFKKVIFAIKEKKSRGKIVGEEGLYKPFYDLFKNR